uniref:Uncharacterized protein LOC100178676 n=1 Tax=Phallusia mammillata TaxID=59560 RepID=A0A6F9DH27_9ASCI|nr:uncharacterized protein LOC100178676 [Phallusia mammillata]
MRMSIVTSQWAIFCCVFCQFWSETDERTIGSYVDWICEDAAPCVRAIRPRGGAAVVGRSAVDYTLEIGVHRRQSEQDELVKKWSSLKYETTWSVEIQWYRLLETKMRVPLPTCRNKLRCQVSLLGDDVQQLDTSSNSYVYRHYLVEVRFQGHPSVSSMELILRKDSLNSEAGPVRQETVKPRQDNDKHSFAIDDDINDVRNHPKYDWLFNRKSNFRGADDITSDDDTNGVQPQGDDVEKYPNIVQAQYDVINDVDDTKVSNDFVGNEIPDDYDAINWNNDVIQSDSGLEKYTSEITDKTQAQKDDGLSVGWIVVLCLLSALIPACIVAFCCLRRKKPRKRRKLTRDDFDVGIPATSSSRDDHHQSKRGRFARYFKSRSKKDFQPFPSQGPRKVRTTKSKAAKYERLNADATDDEEVFPTDRSGLLGENSNKRDEERRDRIQMLKDKSKLLRERATTFVTSARRKSGVIKDDVTKFAHHSGKRVAPILRRIFEWCVGLIRRCCGEKYQERADFIDTSNTSDEYGGATKIIIGKSAPSPSSGKEKSLHPEADISGRFYFSTKPKGSINRDDIIPTSSGVSPLVDDVIHTSLGVSPSVPITCSIHVPSKGNCGLHCLQRHATEEIVTSSDTSSPQSTTSVTSIGSDVSATRTTRGNGDGPTVSNGPSLPNVLLQTRASFRRENRRMQNLLRNWEERSKSNVTNSGATSQRSRVIIGSRRSASEDRFMRIGVGQNETNTCPPKLLTRKERISRVILAGKVAIDSSTNADDSPGCNRERPKKFYKTPSRKSSPVNQKSASSQTTSSTSSSDDVYEMTSQGSDVTFQSKRTDVTKNREAPKKNLPLISTSVTSKLDDVKSSDVIECGRASEALRLAVHAFLASDDDDVMVASDDEFWKEATSLKRC